MFGSFVCGWACPFGFLQDLIASVPTPKFTLPAWMGVFRYVVLAGVCVGDSVSCGAKGIRCSSAGCVRPGAIEAALPNMARLAIAGEPIVWPTAAKTDDPRRDPGGHVLHVAAVVYAVLSLGGDLRAVEPRLVPVPSLSSRSLRRLRPTAAVCASTARRPEQRIDGLRCVRCLECTNCRAVTVETIFTATRQSD